MTQGDITKLGNTDTTCSGATIDVTCLTVAKNLEVVSFGIKGTGSMSNTVTFNGDTGSEYALIESKNGGGRSTRTNQSNLLIRNSSDHNEFHVYQIVNISGQEKLGIIHGISRDCAGECTAPERGEIVFKYDPTSLCTNITQITHTSSADGYAVGSSITVWGAED